MLQARLDAWADGLAWIGRSFQLVDQESAGVLVVFGRPAELLREAPNVPINVLIGH